jgi:hypothetical protein
VTSRTDVPHLLRERRAGRSLPVSARCDPGSECGNTAVGRKIDRIEVAIALQALIRGVLVEVRGGLTSKVLDDCKTVPRADGQP